MAPRKPEVLEVGRGVREVLRKPEELVEGKPEVQVALRKLEASVEGKEAPVALRKRGALVEGKLEVQEAQHKLEELVVEELEQVAPDKPVARECTPEVRGARGDDGGDGDELAAVADRCRSGSRLAVGLRRMTAAEVRTRKADILETEVDCRVGSRRRLVAPRSGSWKGCRSRAEAQLVVHRTASRDTGERNQRPGSW